MGVVMRLISILIWAVNENSLVPDSAIRIYYGEKKFILRFEFNDSIYVIRSDIGKWETNGILWKSMDGNGVRSIQTFVKLNWTVAK